MSTITIRKLDDTTKDRLRMRAARHRRSMEEEARTILRNALAEGEAPTLDDLGRTIHARFKVLGGVDLVLPSRTVPREPPKPR